MNYITCKNLKLGYEGEVVTSGINFQVNEGDYLCIIGENGVGKSTLVKTLVGLKKPMDGIIDYGADVKNVGIGYLPQQTELQRDFPASVEEIVMTGFLNKCGRFPFYTKEMKTIARENMEKMNIYDLKKRCYKELSGGQQQRVLLTRALCATNKLLILDEPVTGLDVKVTCEFYGILSELNKSGVTIVMVSHDLEEATGHAKQMLHLGKEQLFYGSKEDYIKTEIWHEFHEHHKKHCHNGGAC